MDADTERANRENAELVTDKAMPKWLCPSTGFPSIGLGFGAICPYMVYIALIRGTKKNMATEQYRDNANVFRPFSRIW